MKKIYLTGSSGLLGSSIYDLLKKKYKIIKISNDKKYKKSKKVIYSSFESVKDINKIIKKKRSTRLFYSCGVGENGRT